MISPLSFKSRIRVDNSKLAPKDVITLNKNLDQFTRMYREGLKESLDIITTSFPEKLDPTKPPPQKPVDFLVYACSSGLESYSIILYLIDKYGSLEEAKKRVKIHSIDIPSPGLNMAKSGKLHLDENDHHHNHYVTGLNQKIKNHLLEEREFFPSHYIKKEIYNYANFREGRIIEDFEPNGRFNEKEPVVLFFRNALAYIKENNAFSLINNLNKKLPPDSFLCVGDFDLVAHSAYEKIYRTFEPIYTPTNLPCVLFKKSTKRGTL